MKPRTSTKVVASAAIVMGWTWLTAIQCGDVTDPLTVQRCETTKDGNFPTSANFYFNKPAKCPLTLGGWWKTPYAASADFYPGSIVSGYYEGRQTTWKGTIWNFWGNPVWSQGSNGRHFVIITGDYDAAYDGFDANGGGWDDIRNGFSLTYSQSTYVTTRIPYKFGIPTNFIDAPAAVESGASYLVSATTDDVRLTGPVTWSWYVDDSLVGTTADPEFNVQAGEPSTQQHVAVLATGDNGHTVWGHTWVSVSAGCGPGLIC